MAKKTLLKPPAIAPGAGVTEALHGTLYRAVSDLILFSDASPVTVFTVPANTIVYDVFIEIVELFNGTSPTLDVGVSGTAARHLPSADITEGTVGFYGNSTLRPFKYTTDTDIILTNGTTGSPTTGKCRVYILWMPYADENLMVK